MGRKGRGKKQSSSHEDTGSGDEEKIPPQKRRGRPQKLPKDDSDWEGSDKVEEDGELETAKTDNNSEKYKRKKRNLKEKLDSVEEVIAVAIKPSTDEDDDDDSVKRNGFRQNGSRRKSKPRRAAEFGVECK